ncbi:hypothetical protein F4776DRAFT_669214 [Hypoxylon sp. NC0597]|nr:hypothetical protein F4776DRAFT_669214 [Hypoxylon sp. NC0597]
MKKDTCISKHVVEMRSSLNPPIKARLTPIKFDREASYILCGGLGGAGREVAIWMVENVFLDAFARYRNGLGLPATTIDVGVIEDTGMTARDKHIMRAFKTNGYMTIRSKEALDAMSLPVTTSSARPGRSIPGDVDRSSFGIGLGYTILHASSDDWVP